MRILDAFRDWLSDSEEKEKFIKHWKSNNPTFVSHASDAGVTYHSSVAYEVAKMQALLDAHSAQIKEILDALPKA